MVQERWIRTWGGASSPGGARGGRRWTALLGLVLPGALLLGACGDKARPGHPPRHVILLTVAGMRPDHMSVYLYDRPTTVWEFTPQDRADGRALSLDDLGVAGVLFANAFTPSPWAGPAAASLLTGRSPLEHGWVEDQGTLGEDEDTVVEAFAAQGFRTAAFVPKGQFPEGSGLDQGFETFLRVEDDIDVVRASMNWFDAEDLGDGRPFFVWMHFEGPRFPHDPGRGGARFDGQPGNEDFARLFADPGYGGAVDGSAGWAGGLEGIPSGPDLQHLRDLYDGEISEVAWLMRRFLSYFSTSTDAAGAWQDAVCLFAGLHGTELFEEGRVGQGASLPTTVTRVPLFMRHPSSLTGSRILSAPVDLCDVAPTLMDWFEIEGQEGVSGRSLLALTDSYIEREFEERPLLAVGGPGRMAVRVRGGSLRWGPDREGLPRWDPAPLPIDRPVIEPQVDAEFIEDLRARAREARSALRIEDAAIESWVRELLGDG